MARGGPKPTPPHVRCRLKLTFRPRCRCCAGFTCCPNDHCLLSSGDYERSDAAFDGAGPKSLRQGFSRLLRSLFQL